MKSRRQFFTEVVAPGSALLALGPAVVVAQPDYPPFEVWKSSTCTCCAKWISHLEAAGFDVTATNVPDVGVYKAKLGLPSGLSSCHTALVDGYVVEGHVPATDIIRMLETRPDIKGIAVPGMPLGSPGMESPNPQSYEVVAFTAEGKTSVFARHPVDG